jgi:topoisomerase-4 subunit A
MISITEVEYPRFEIYFGGKHKSRENEIIEVAEFIGVKSYKAKGKRMTNYMVENIQEIEPIVKKESASPSDGDPDNESLPPPPPVIHNDPAQMKLEL